MIKLLNKVRDKPNYLYQCDRHITYKLDLVSKTTSSNQFMKGSLENWYNAFVYLMGLDSLFMCAVTTVSILKVAKLRDSHPNKLIAVIAAAEFIACWMILIY